MNGEVISVGGLRLSSTPNIMDGAWYQRSVREHVDGNVSVFQVTGPYELQAEIHYIQLDNGERWVVLGESYKGPKWIWQQTKDRLRMSVIQKGERFAFDLPLPTPGKKNKEIYTMSCASEKEIESLLPEFRELFFEYGVKEIGARKDLFNDTSSRKKYISAIIDDPECLSPIVAFCVTRLSAIIKKYEELKQTGEIEFTHMVDEYSNNLNNGNSIEQTIAKGETAYVEFKPAIWYDYGRAMNDSSYILKKEQHVSDNVVRTVAGFLNAEGGTLFVGVSDDGDAYGLEGDVALTGRADLDGLENELNQLISTSVSKEVSAAKIKISLPKFQGKTIAMIVVEKANSPVFMKTSRHQNKFYVRIGNATNTLSVESAFNYISQHNWES